MCPSQDTSSDVYSTSYNNDNMNMPPKPAMVQRTKSTDKTKKLLPMEFQPSEYSVICGNKRAFFNSVGNRRFRVICQMHLSEFMNAPSKHEKSFVVTKVMKTLKDACPDGGAFVTLEQGRWWEVSDRTSREKIGTFFRDNLSDSYKSSSRNKVAQRKQNRSCSPSPRSRSSSPSAPRGRSVSPCPRGRAVSPGPHAVSPCPSRSVSPAPMLEMQQPLPSMYSSPIPSRTNKVIDFTPLNFYPTEGEIITPLNFFPTAGAPVTPLTSPTAIPSPLVTAIPSPFVMDRPAPIARVVSDCLDESTNDSIEFNAANFFDHVDDFTPLAI